MNATKKLLTWLTVTMAVIGLSSQLAARDLYWSEYGGVAGTAVIKAADIDGSNETVIFEGTEMTSFIVDIAVTDDHIYWTGHSGGDVWRANRDGSEAGRIIEPGNGLTSVHNIAVDEAAGKLHIACHSNGIFQADLDGGNLSQVLGQTWTTNSAITVRASDEVLFVATNDANLYWYDPTAEWPFATSRPLEGGNQTYGLAYEPGADMLYYTVWSSAGAPGSLYSHNMATLETTLLRSDIVAPLGLKLSPDGSHLLIAQRGMGVGAYRISDGGYQLIAPASAAHFGVAVSANPELDDPTFPPPPPEDGDVLLEETFDNIALGELTPDNVGDYDGAFSRITWHPSGGGTMAVVEDGDNLFGRGSANRVLVLDDAHGWALRSENQFAEEVLTLKFEMFHQGQFHPSLTDRMTNRFFVNAVSHNDTVINFGLQQRSVEDGTYRVRGIATDIQSNELQRWVLVVNNSENTVEYDSPEGPQSLAPQMSAVWLNGERFAEDYDYLLANGQPENFPGPGPMRFFTMETFSNNAWSGLIDNIRIYKGALIPEDDSVVTGYAAWAAANFPGVTDEAVIGPSADPSGNGVPNLIKYVLAMDPNSASLEGLPVQGTVPAEDDKEYLTLTFATADAADDAEWEVLVSGSVEGDWTAGAVEVSRTPNGDGTTTWVFRDSVAISEAGGGRRFMLFSATLD